MTTVPCPPTRNGGPTEMKSMRALRALGRAQTGAALPLALLALLMLSVLGFTLAMLGTTEVTVATNWRAYTTAFYEGSS